MSTIDDTNLEGGEVHRDWLDDDDRGVLIDVVCCLMLLDVGCFPPFWGGKLRKCSTSSFTKIHLRQYDVDVTILKALW